MSELSLAPVLPIQQKVTEYRDKVRKSLDALQAKRERLRGGELKRELGVIGVLSSASSEPLETECYITSYESTRRGARLPSTHLAWDLGPETSSDDPYANHLFLTQSDHRFYRGDTGNAHTLDVTARTDILDRISDLRQQF